MKFKVGDRCWLDHYPYCAGKIKEVSKASALVRWQCSCNAQGEPVNVLIGWMQVSRLLTEQEYRMKCYADEAIKRITDEV